MRNTYWHKRSWEGFVGEGLPNLLSERLDIVEYRCLENDGSYEITMSVNGLADKALTATYVGIPFPGEEGTFAVDGSEVVVIPLVETESLENVRCCGEQMLEFLERRVSSAPDGFFTDEESVRSWIPLSEWFREFFLENAQVVDNHNYAARQTHLSRIRIQRVADFAPESQIGKACPVETPEGPNIGKILTIARGASIEGDTVVINESSAESSLGFAASMIPFFEHSDPARLLMGANMLRQWIPPEMIEPALVRSGLEPEEPKFWCGFNLLTAFTSVGFLNCEDGLVLSLSAAQRMKYSTPLEIGDKLSTRHGDKGVISAILPDDKMPRLGDGTPVDIVFSFTGLHTRMNTGVLLEAVAGRIAQATGKPFAARPFQSPGRKKLSRILGENSLPQHGMERLKFPEHDSTPEFPTLAGWVYWGRTRHNVEGKLRATAAPSDPIGSALRVGEMEYWVLRDAGLYKVINENLGIRSERSIQADGLLDLVAAGGALPSNFPSVPVLTLQRKLRGAGIDLEIGADALAFSWHSEGDFSFTEPVQHPWCPSCLCTRLSPDRENRLWAPVERENAKLGGLNDSNAPRSLVDKSKARLAELFEAYLGSIIQENPSDLACGSRVLFSMKSVIVPSALLGTDSVGVPDEAAWKLFGPLAARRIGKSEVDLRSEKAAVALDETMAETHVIVWRAPSVEMTNAIAFKPVRVQHRSIELNPLVCRWMNADFDGDQVGLYLPLGPEAQAEIAQKLTVAAHLRRDPGLIDTLIPPHEAVWGLSLLRLSEQRKDTIESLAGTIATHSDLLTQSELQSHMREIVRSEGAEKAICTLEGLMKIGFEAAATSGASLDPFMDLEGLAEVPCASKWDSLPKAELVFEWLESADGYLSSVYGPQLMLAKAGIRGGIDNLIRLLLKRRETAGEGLLGGIRHAEYMKLSMEMRRSLAKIAFRWEGIGSDMSDQQTTKATTVLARARRAQKPGIVFASAASRGEKDPLTDKEARLFSGLLPK
jgi:hypothetical protein